MTNKLEQISKLKDDWNCYGAKTFSKELINYTKNLVKQLPFPPKIFPTAANSIQLEYNSPNGNYIEFEIYEKDFTIKVYIEKGDTCVIISEISINEEKMVELLYKYY